MLARVAWAFLAMSCVSGPSTVAAQSTAYQFTMGVTSPAPVPGQPFTITWTGGEPTDTVYIVLNGYFPALTTQNIIYTTTDILCKLTLYREVLLSFPELSTDAYQQMLLTTDHGFTTCL
jgi:hypothetical protein